MKKHNEGYALPFVLVVSVVMCIIATTVMTFSLDNLKSQQRTVERMQAKYEAAGAIEEIVGAIEMPPKQGEIAVQNDGQENLPAITFDGNEKCSFVVDGQNILRIASSGNYNEDGELWIIVSLKLEKEAVETITDFKDGSMACEMTIKDHCSVEYVGYEIADRDTAYDFLFDAAPPQNTGEEENVDEN